MHLVRVLWKILYCSIFSVRQLVQVLVEAYHLASLHDAPRRPQFVRVPDKMVYPIPWATLCRSRDLVPGTIFSFSWYLD